MGNGIRFRCGPLLSTIMRQFTSVDQENAGAEEV